MWMKALGTPTRCNGRTDNEIADIAGSSVSRRKLRCRVVKQRVWIYNMENQPDAGDPHSFTRDVTDAVSKRCDLVDWPTPVSPPELHRTTLSAPDENLKRAQADSIPCIVWLVNLLRRRTASLTLLRLGNKVVCPGWTRPVSPPAHHPPHSHPKTER